MLLWIGAAILIGVVYFIYKSTQRPEVSWTISFDRNSKQPYGTAVLHELLSENFEGRELSSFKNGLDKALPQTDNQEGYIFINQAYATNPKDLMALANFVAHGGTALIAAEAFPVFFFEKYGRVHCKSTTDSIYDSHSLSFDDVSTVNMFLTPGKFSTDLYVPFTCIDEFKPSTHEWHYLEEIENDYCRDPESELTPIGFFDQRINFARIQYGKGAIYLHTNPLAFTNLFALKDSNLTYIERVMSHLPKGKIHWDSHTPGWTRDINAPFMDKKPAEEAQYSNDSTPLRYILSQPALAWSWYLSLGLIALFILFMGKRRQNIIPVLPVKENTSLDFIKTIGQMYFQSADFQGVCAMKLKQFQTFIRTKYGIQTRALNTTECIQAVALKSDIPEEQVRKIALFEAKVENRDITQDSMVALHEALEKFYKNCK